ncbi:MAG TPA: amidohydrolase family protein [Bryobacteraceae bacterium]|jgi:imidazolonepropionase-like amidohydrolase|nr:amidohydrolase family protein [Bryobacteraceae bacterium]
MRLPALLLLAISAVPLAADSILIRNVTVHPVTAPDIANGSVLIVDGKIAEVGSEIAARDGSRIIDGHGLHLYPGLINAATNVGLEEIGSLRDTVDLDEIGLFNPELRAEQAFNPSSEHIEVTRAAGVTTVVSLPGSGERNQRGGTPMITGQGALMHMNGWTWEEMAVKPATVMDLLFPENETISPQMAAFFGTQGRTYADQEKEHKQQIRELHEFFEQARHYQIAKTANPPGFQRDLRLDAMIPVLEGRLPLFIRAAREPTIKEAVQFAGEERIKMILAGPVEIGSTGSLLKEKNIPVVLGASFALPVHDDDPYDSRYSLATEFYKAGVKICFGTFDVQFARNVPFEAAQAVAFGLPHDEALKAITINSAEVLGARDQIGSIEKGKIADVILTDGDPMEAGTSIKRMFIAGQEVSLESRHTREYQKWLARP